MVEACEHPGRAVCNFCSRRPLRCRLQPRRDRCPKTGTGTARRRDRRDGRARPGDHASSTKPTIGISGPEQIEDAIETLDAQTESRPPLVSGIGGTRCRSLPAGDLFERIRTGFVLDDVDHADGRARSALVRQASRVSRPHLQARRALPATTSSTRSKRARCRSSSRCCRSSRARSIPSPIRGRAPPACGSSFPAPAAATA